MCIRDRDAAARTWRPSVDAEQERLNPNNEITRQVVANSFILKIILRREVRGVQQQHLLT